MRIQESEGVGGWVAIGNFTMLSRALQNLTKYKCVCVGGGGGGVVNVRTKRTILFAN